MESFAEILKVGGHFNSLGRAEEVLDLLRKDAARLDELFECISDDDAWVRMRAVDTFEKLVKQTPALATPYLNEILSSHTNSDQPSIQWHLAEIFTEANLNDEQQKQAIEWLKSRIDSVDVDWIVSVNTMKALLYFYELGLVDAQEIKSLFQIQTEHHSKSVRKKATLLMQEI